MTLTRRFSFFNHPLVLALLILVLMGPLSCRKKTAPSETPSTPKPEIVKITLPLSQLQGLQINGQQVSQMAALSEDPQTLSGSDLAQAFNISSEDYQQRALTLIQSQLQSGSPLQNVLIFLGRLPKKYAAQCASLSDPSLEDDTCLIEPLAFYCQEALPQENWSTENYQKLCQSLGRLKAYNPKYLVALFDGDNTLWYQDVSNAGVKRGVDSKRLQWALGKVELLPVYPKVEEREAYLKEKTPYDYYQELYKKVGPLWNYNFAASAFRGLSLKETFANFQEWQKEAYAPVIFPEMQALLKYLNKEGIVTGVVSASPIFGVLPMMESMETAIPLSRMEGLDVFIQNPADLEALPVSILRLLNQGKNNEATGQAEPFQNYAEFLAQYGDWIIVDVDPVINARSGKGAQSRSIMRRHVAEQNRQASNTQAQIDIEDMRLVLIGGDNFAPGTDIFNSEGTRSQAALENGNDQGMSESGNFLAKANEANQVPGGTDILFIFRQVLTAEGLVEPKEGSLENFNAYASQQKLLRPNNLGDLIIQPAITDVKSTAGKGGFLKDPPPSPSTTPVLEPAKEAVPEAPAAGGSPTEVIPTNPSNTTAPAIPTSPTSTTPNVETTPTEAAAPTTAPAINPNPEAEAIEVAPTPLPPTPPTPVPNPIPTPPEKSAPENDAD